MDHSTDQTGSELFSKRYGKKEPCIQTNEKERGTTMEIREAVIKAQNGDQSAFSFLYEETYKSKYYLALKYMKNKEAAEDVLQDAYLKAFSKLGTLKQPEAFEGWLGMIVANTAKNMLAKKNPMLFSELAVDGEGEEYVYDVEDDNPENQPELAYTQEETKELVYEMMDTLSEEQRMCILMFHIENISISEIARTMDCSENTVKSRLNYGRKNLKSKAEEMQKKGYRLYSVAPIPLLLYLLSTDQKVMAAEPAFRMAGKKVEAAVLKEIANKASTIAEKTAAMKSSTSVAGKTAAKSSASVTGKTAAKSTASVAGKSAVGKIAAGKIAAAVVATCIVGAGSYGVYQLNNENHMADRLSKAATTAQMTEDTDTTTDTKSQQKKENKQQQDKKQDKKQSDQTEIRNLYEQVLTDVQNGKYEFTQMEDNTDYYYFVTDIDGDQIPELGVGPKQDAAPMAIYDLRLFSCEQTANGYELVTIQGEENVEDLHIAADGNGLLMNLITQGTGMCEVHRITVRNKTLVYGSAEQTFRIDDTATSEFENSNQEVSWKSITDQSGLQVLK